MKKSAILLAIAAATLALASCQKNDESKSVDPVSATFRFVASEDFQKLYEIKMYWRCEGGSESKVNIVCDKELDNSFVCANQSFLKSYLKGGTFKVGNFTSTTTIEYRLDLTRKASVQIDTTAKYDIIIGQDVTSYGDEDYIASTDNQIMGLKGLKGSKVEEYIETIRDFFEEDKYAEIEIY